MYTRFPISTMHLMCLNDLISKTFNPCLSEVRSENSLVICQQPWFKHLKFDYFFCYVGTNTYLLCKLFEKNKCKSAHFYWASWWLSVKNPSATTGEADSILESGRSSGEESVNSLPGKPHGQRSPAGYRPWGCKESHVI